MCLLNIVLHCLELVPAILQVNTVLIELRVDAVESLQVSTAQHSAVGVLAGNILLYSTCELVKHWGTAVGFCLDDFSNGLLAPAAP